MPSTIKTRIFIISDTHDGFQRHTGDDPYSEKGPFRPPLPTSDVLIHSGDLTMLGTIEQYRGALKMLSSINSELKLVIAGNHDLSLHGDYYLNHPAPKRIASKSYDASFVEKAKEMWTGEEARKAGVTYLVEGIHTFELSNGAKFSVYASPWQPVFYDWAFNYPKSEDRWNPPHLVDPKDPTTPEAVPAPPEQDPHPIHEGEKIDIMITHGPPWMHLDRCYNGYHAGCPHLLKALNRVRPLMHCFGHIHEAWGAEVVQWKSDNENSGSDGKLGEKTTTYGSLSEEIPSVQRPMDREAIERRANYLDVSSTSRKPLIKGEETLLVNSCIMDLEYHAEGSGWLVDIDLPVMER